MEESAPHEVQNLTPAGSVAPQLLQDRLGLAVVIGPRTDGEATGPEDGVEALGLVGSATSRTGGSRVAGLGGTAAVIGLDVRAALAFCAPHPVQNFESAERS
jgi:hypothetical protein